MIKDLKFIHFLTASFVIELFMMFLFRFTRFSSSVINNWYDNLGWTAIILDILSILIGFYIAKFIYHYLVSNGYITSKNGLLKYLFIVLVVQILHDILFYYKVIVPTPIKINKVIDEFKEYAKHYRSQAILADSLIYLSTTPILYYIIRNQSNSSNIFTTIVCFYIIGYLLHQKPLIN